MCTLLLLFLLSSGSISEGSPPAPKDMATVQASILPSLQSILSMDKQDQLLGSLLPQTMLDQLESLTSRKDLNEDLVPELRQLVIKRGGLARTGVLHFLEAVMKGIMRALEMDFREVFITLVNPIVELAVMLNPLPEYQYTMEPMDGDKEMRYIQETFNNWGSTLLTNVTVKTFFPRTVQGIQNIVKMAAKEGRRVRASATRHTFNPWLWGLESEMQPGEGGENVHYMISMLPQEISDHLAYTRDWGTWPEDSSELVFIEGPLKVWRGEEGGKKAAVRFGAATLNKHYMEWALKHNWTLPYNTIMHFMTMGGVMMGTCHGGGISHGTMGDLLLEVQYVDAAGQLVTLTDPVHLQTFGGSMGMLGIVTSLTYQLDEMTYARFWPQQVEGGYPAIVPPPGYPVPNNTIQWMNHYYSEFIQYPTHHNAGGVLWKNTWDNHGRAEDAITPLIDHVEDEFQRDYTFLEDVCVRLFKTLLEHFPAEDYLYWVFGYAVGQASKLAMKHWEEPVTTTALEAMHFQRGLHYLSVRAAEMIVPIPELEDGTPDWDVVQQVLYDLVEVLGEYERNELYPVDLAIEDRFMSGTKMLLGAQYGNKFTLAIEVTSSPMVKQDLWEEFKVSVAENWENYYDREGNKLSVKPHWAKEFPREVAGQHITHYMAKEYRNQMELYVQGMHTLMEVTGGNLTNTLNMFSTKYMDKLMVDFL